MTITPAFSQKDWERTEVNWSAWWAHELERPMVLMWGIDPKDVAAYTMPKTFAAAYPLDTPVEEVIRIYQARLEALKFYGDAWPRWVPNFGPGIPAAFLGAEVQVAPDTIWFSPIYENTPLKDIHLVHNPENIWWKRVIDMVQCAIDTWGDQVTIGHTTLSGNLDILAHLRTSQKMLTDLIDEPEEVDRLVREMTGLWLYYYDELEKMVRKTGRGTTFWIEVFSPRRCAALQSDLCYMISPRMFKRFVLPDLQACCDHIEHCIYHLDGKGELPHVDQLLAMEKLRAIQWIPGAGAPPAEEWLPLLRQIRDGGKFCQVYVTAEGARKIVKEVGGKGFVFVIIEVMRDSEASALYHELTGYSMT
jgi:5-methyltetrahydrofolate--homocysteine methyltransferase